MSVRDRVIEAIAVAQQNGVPKTISFSPQGWMLARAEVRAEDGHLYYDTRSSEWFCLNLRVIQDRAQSAPWLVRFDPWTFRHPIRTLHMPPVTWKDPGPVQPIKDDTPWRGDDA